MIFSKEQVRFGSTNYPVIIAENFLGLSEELSRFEKISKLFILTEKKIADLYLKDIFKELKKFNPECILIGGSEKNKHIDNLKSVYQKLILKGADRKSFFLAFGGGVVGDFVGFVAATFLRGVRYAQIPTTLLASVDSSVGGKVAVNVDYGKNMVGAFYQPSFVFLPIYTLNTLKKKEWNCGLAEIVKHSFLEGGDFLNFIENHSRKDIHALSPVVRKCIEDSVKFKTKIVSIDEKETGLRAILNLGHSTAHAIESATNYRKYSHGEAVSIGLVTCLILSKNRLGFSEKSLNRSITILKNYELPLNHSLKPSLIVSHIKHDKKNEGDTIKFVLLKNFGEPEFGVSVSKEEIFNTLKIQNSIVA
ncbi:MAG: 3-dehydroquinate synthase [Leptospiraceae bacterium]|nr:3-dehydroquinate synthase [Leptospiraceae bacterium]MCK6380683.1 3-dehydroquinate synthase [Leptospiraceae bacterium]NUM42629.1 3-dehydroquinate synthase [Leptospiraceae bacterium]